MTDDQKIEAIKDAVDEMAEKDPQLAETLARGRAGEMSSQDAAVLAGAIASAEEGRELFDKASGKPAVEAEDKERVSDVCQKCNGACCRAFATEVRIKPIHAYCQHDGWEVDWDAMLEKSGTTREEVDFERENWMPIEQPWGRFDRVIARVASSGWITAKVWFSCKQVKDGRCQAYDRRPPPCRQFLCEAAERQGTPPIEALCTHHDSPVLPGLGVVRVLHHRPLVAVFDSENQHQLHEMEQAMVDGVRLGIRIGRGLQLGDPVEFEPPKGAEPSEGKEIERESTLLERNVRPGFEETL